MTGVPIRMLIVISTSHIFCSNCCQKSSQQSSISMRILPKTFFKDLSEISARADLVEIHWYNRMKLECVMVQPKFQGREELLKSVGKKKVSLEAAPASDRLDNELRDREIDPVFNHYNERL